jgi:hypothetical protein
VSGLVVSVVAYQIYGETQVLFFYQFPHNIRHFQHHILHHLQASMYVKSCVSHSFIRPNHLFLAPQDSALGSGIGCSCLGTDTLILLNGCLTISFLQDFHFL